MCKTVHNRRLLTNLSLHSLLLEHCSLKDSPSCDRGHPNQTIHHIVNECHLRRFDEGFRAIHMTTDRAVIWLSNLD